MIRGNCFLIVFIALFLFSIPLNSVQGQNWQMEGSASYPVTRILPDTVENTLYIGGGFKYFNSILVNGIAKWDGINVVPFGSGRTKDCWSVNCFDLVLLSKYNNELYIGYVNDTISGTPAKGIARWNGFGWSDVGEGLTELTYGRGGIPFDGYIGEDKLLIGGAFEKAGLDTAYSLAAWDGASWQGYDVPPPDQGTLHFITTVGYYKNKLYIAGNFVMYLDGQMTHDIAVLDDGSWRSVGKGLKGGESYINDMIVFKDELYVCGYFRSSSGNVGNKIMRWNSVEWKEVGGGLCSPFDIAERMLVYDDKLYVVGIFDCVGNGIPASCIATWDGEHWCSLGNSKFNNKIRDVAVWNNNIYIGGGFTEVDGQPVRYFARWIGDHSADTCSTPVVSAPAAPAAKAPALHFSPNPASDRLSVFYPDPTGGPVQLRVFDSAGRECSALVTVQSAGRSGELELHTGNLPAGLYFCVVRTTSGVYGGRFVRR